MTSQHYRDILTYLRDLIAGTRWEGCVYAVGGCCRDEILGTEIKDIDLAVELPGGGLDFAQWLYENDLCVSEPSTFPAFGTAMLRLAVFPEDEIEIVQTRAEKYTDDTVGDPTIVFGSKEADCRRRDLTVNALYYDISGEKLLDILGTSVDDIHNHVIRTPDSPDVTFEDDPVRILRAIRLAARYDWPIEEVTLAGMQNNYDRLRDVRPHRLMAEVEKMLLSDEPARSFELMRTTGALNYVFPELLPLVTINQERQYQCTSWEHTLKVLELCPRDLPVRMAALFHDIGKPEAAYRGRDGHLRFTNHERQGRGLVCRALHRWRCDNDFINRVIFLISNQKATVHWGTEAQRMTDENLRRLQHRCLSPVRFTRLMSLIDADNRSFPSGSNMQGQVPHIVRRSEELCDAGTALFYFKQQIPDSKIRKMKGLPSDTDMTPYRDFLLSLAVADPLLAEEEVKHRMKKFKPRASKVRSGKNESNKKAVRKGNEVARNKRESKSKMRSKR